MKHPAKLFGLFLLTPIVAASTGTATALSSENSSSIAAVPDTPPPAVEEYNYPGSDQIFAEREIRLLKGDGNIILTDCGTENPVIKVESFDTGTSCYEVTRGQGWLTMEIPRVYAIQGDDHNVAARLTTNGETEAVDITPGEHVPVGETTGDDPATLVELHAS